MMKFKAIQSVSITLLLLCTLCVNSQTRNYVRTWDAKAPETNPNTLQTKTARDVMQATQYVDGLGRPEQTVVKQGSLSAAGSFDLVSPVVYDAYGRQAEQYLPYASGTNGLFKTDALTAQNTFYTGSNSPVVGQSESHFYAKTEFEASPLNRVNKQMAPGANWNGASRGVEQQYLFNTTNDAVRIWTVTNVSGAFGTINSDSSYPAGVLYKTITVDEGGKKVAEFKDKGGRVLLKRVQISTTTPADGHSDWLCTYYIYDDFSQLRAVIQPEGVKTLAGSSWALTTTLYAEQCFRYEYDARGRMIMKKVPGAGEVYMVYDERNRLVMTQDANLRTANKWMVTLYDELNRPVQTGLLLNTFTSPAKTFAEHRTAASVSSAYPFVLASPPSTTYWEYLTKTGYDGYTTIPGASGLNSTINTTYINGTYGFFTTYNASPEYAQQIPSAASSLTNGLVTWTETKVLGSSTYLYTVMLYDDKGRVVQVKNKNNTGGTDIVTTQYSWAGQPLITVQQQEKAGSPAQTTIVVTKLIYDDLGRLVQTDKKIRNSNVNTDALASSYTTISQLEYDALGQLKTKKLAPAYKSNTGLETIAYDYNIRGWLLGANRAYIGTQGQSGSTRFGFELGYDKQTNSSGNNFTASQYNGNISGMIWKSDGDDVRRKYDYSYDAANRLLQGLFKQDNGGSTWNNTVMDYTIKMGDGIDPSLAYDRNGNIKGMTQYGWKITDPAYIMDKLEYTYGTSSNKLLKVFDNLTSTTDNGKLGDFKDGSNGSGNDYTYDDNGNLTADNNKTISSITYNHLNLPLVVTVTGKGTITYTYDAAGTKQKKVTTETGATVPYNGTNYTNVTITTTTTYLGGLVFETKNYSNSTVNTGIGYTDRLQFIAHEEGRVRFKADDNSLHYDYMLKDHLGNVRMVLTEEEKTDTYETLTFENTNSAKQNAEWDNASGTSIDITNVRTAAVSGFSGGSNGDFVRTIKKSTGSIGAAKLLKVMAGDRIHTYVDYFYSTTNSSSNNSAANPINSFVSGLAGAFSTTNQVGSLLKGDVSAINSQLSGNTDFTSFINPSPNTSGGNEAPKAYLNILFFDDQFKFDEASSRIERVSYTPGSKDHIDRLFSAAITANKSGYAYIYFSNESETPVYFDNFMLSHERSSLIEETHYYPFGLTMAGISSKAVNFGKENRYKFNDGTELASKEFSDGMGLELYETMFRTYDPQIGRWWQIDPLIEVGEDFTPYAFADDNPISLNDPYGLLPSGNDNNQNYTGYIRRNDGTIYFDPNVHGQKDLDPKSGLTYLGERIKVTNGEGKAVWWDENGTPNMSDPGWENLQNVTVTASGKKSNDFGFSFSGLLDDFTSFKPTGFWTKTGPILGSSLQNFKIPPVIRDGIIIFYGSKSQMKPFVMKGSSTRTSVASILLRKIIPSKWTVKGTLGNKIGSIVARKLGTNGLGAATGRSVPYIGWGMLLLYDAPSLTTEIFQEIMNDGDFIDSPINSGQNSGDASQGKIL